MSSYGYEAPRRPGAVTAAAVLLYIFAGLGILSGLLLFTAAAGGGLLTGLTLFLLALSALYIVLATMILKGNNGARITTIVLLSISLVLNLANFDTSSILSIGLGLLVIGLLAWNRESQQFFRAAR